MANSKKRRKRFYLVIPIYVVFIILFEVILSFGMKDIWDDLKRWGDQ